LPADFFSTVERLDRHTDQLVVQQARGMNKAQSAVGSPFSKKRRNAAAFP
jgi:hypothetical protein